jgi:protease-4
MREFLNKVWDIKVPLLILCVALLVGIGISFLIPQPVVGVITLNDAIYDYSAQYLIEQIVYAEQSPEVMAVVLVMNSPGGTVVDTEAVYLELARLRRSKPVVTVISGMAASGGYYLASGTDYIIAKPSSQVGNIGVIGYLPPSPQVFEEIYSTGPYKLWGSPQDTVVREIEMIKQGFFEAIKLGRSDTLQMTDSEVLRGQIYMGSEALRKGLVDELGGETLAYQIAANMARISNYRIKDLNEAAGLPVYDPYAFFSQSSDGRSTAYPKDAGIYLLYIPPSER